jgi:hypothetical protein
MTKPFLRPGERGKQRQVRAIVYQSPLPLLKSVCPPNLSELTLIAGLPSFRSTLRMGVNESGMLQEDIAEILRYDATSFSRIIKDPRHAGDKSRNLDHEKLADFCLVTGCLAPVQWHAFRAGYGLVALRELRAQNLERLHAPDRARRYLLGQQEVA